MKRRDYPHTPWLFITMTLLIGVFTAGAQNWVQWSSAAGGNDHYYRLTPVATNWEAAEKLAVSWGGTLATIASSNEQEFINKTFLTGALERRPVWIGLFNPPKHGPFNLNLGPVKLEVGGQPKPSYRWITGEPLTYANWHPGQPDNFGQNENYAAINWFYSDNRGAKGDWNDAPETGTKGFSGPTDGPYLGIVERDYDPRLPVRPPPIFSKSTVHLMLLVVITVILLVYFVRSRKGKKSKGLVTSAATF